ncbi:hypothetical protein [Bifidobacterium sp. SO1]|uniref:hypothetical protein n=1 Tax=Bifidobacterium sp. SO1 TaxID=2809029 RepID=UPI001BDC79E5|nr:hypothetical protein [Bifidobacterium sp. SO1]MBT1161768.1 hypothetical protein [Bifidobacterium sp. SO1]
MDWDAILCLMLPMLILLILMLACGRIGDHEDEQDEHRRIMRNDDGNRRRFGSL